MDFCHLTPPLKIDDVNIKLSYVFKVRIGKGVKHIFVGKKENLGKSVRKVGEEVDTPPPTPFWRDEYKFDHMPKKLAFVEICKKIYVGKTELFGKYVKKYKRKEDLIIPWYTLNIDIFYF